MSETKTCTKCGEGKSVSEFALASYVRKDGTRNYKSECRACRNKRQVEWEHTNPDMSAKLSLGYRKRNRFTYVLGCSRVIAKRNGYAPCSATKGELEAEFTGRCHICGVPEGECNKQLHMDHNHTTGKFRGWLCHYCNMSAGNVHDSPEIALALALYLEKHK